MSANYVLDIFTAQTIYKVLQGMHFNPVLQKRLQMLKVKMIFPGSHSEAVGKILFLISILVTSP